jgi:hypothetical protein
VDDSSLVEPPICVNYIEAAVVVEWLGGNPVGYLSVVVDAGFGFVLGELAPFG